MGTELPEQEENPKGYKSLELEYRDGHLWMPDGTMLEPDFLVGIERHQIDLFIEYERSFGRGRAFMVTHGILRIQDPRIMIRDFGSTENYFSLMKEYESIANEISALTSSGSQEDCLVMIERIKEFRKKCPNLYSDADKHTEPGHL